jgi:hypothetical protein
MLSVIEEVKPCQEAEGLTPTPPVLAIVAPQPDTGPASGYCTNMEEEQLTPRHSTLLSPQSPPPPPNHDIERQEPDGQEQIPIAT